MMESEGVSPRDGDALREREQPCAAATATTPAIKGKAEPQKERERFIKSNPFQGLPSERFLSQ
jgi:hypothetical protein